MYITLHNMIIHKNFGHVGKSKACVNLIFSQTRELRKNTRDQKMFL